MKSIKRTLAAVLLAVALVPSFAHAGDEPPPPSCLPVAEEILGDPERPCEWGFTQWLMETIGI